MSSNLTKEFHVKIALIILIIIASIIILTYSKLKLACGKVLKQHNKLHDMLDQKHQLGLEFNRCFKAIDEYQDEVDKAIVSFINRSQISLNNNNSVAHMRAENSLSKSLNDAESWTYKQPHLTSDVMKDLVRDWHAWQQKWSVRVVKYNKSLRTYEKVEKGFFTAALLRFLPHMQYDLIPWEEDKKVTEDENKDIDKDKK